MFLLNSETIITEQRKGASGVLEIQPFFAENLGSTYYYFTLGPLYRRWNAADKRWEVGDLDPSGSLLNVQPDDYVLVQSRERFRCSRSTLAVFGPASELHRRGLSLRNSLFIDPFFPGEEPGYLELGLKNEITEPVRLRLGDRLGKICFFNVADTYPIEPPKSSKTKSDYQRRSSSQPPTDVRPEYDDDPVEGYQEVVEYGLMKKQSGG